MTVAKQKSQIGMQTRNSIKVGYKQTELGMIPVDWDVKKLGDVGEIKMCRRVFNYETKDAGAIPFYKIGTFGKEADAYISQDLYDNYRHRFSFPQKGDILISAAGTIGRTIVYDGIPAYFQDSNIVWIDNNEELISNDYLYYVFQIVKYNTEGGTIQRLYNNILNNTKFICPTRPEQTAIATILSDTDTLIEHLQKLIAKKKAIKQGAMYQFLTGKRKLSGFEKKKGYKQTELGVIPEDWEIERLGDVLTKPPRYGIGAAAVEYSDKLPKYIRITDISESGRFLPDKTVSVDNSFSANYFLFDGDLVVARTGASVGKSYLYRLKDGPLVFAGFLICLSSNKNRLLPHYLANFFKTTAYWSWVKLTSMRSGQPGINGNEYARLLIPLPPIHEQTAIAATLSDMDTEIESLEEKRNKYMLIKQGMMQQLLTGKIRLLSN